jgi:integrase
VVLVDLIQEYLDSLKTDGLKPSTIKHVRITLNKFNNCIDGKSLLEIDRHDIDRFINELSETCNQKTLKNDIGRLNLFYEFLMEDLEIIDRNPIKRKYKRLTSGNNHTNRPKRSFEEVKDFVRGITNLKDQAMTVLLLKTLIRNSELRALTLNDFDAERGYLIVDKHLDKVTGEVLQGRKNGNVTTIPLDDETVRILKRYLRTRPNVNSNALFVSNLNKHMSEHLPLRTIGGWAKKLHFDSGEGKYSKKITPHWMRAFGTMEMEKRGMNPSVIQYIRGDVPATTMDGYSRSVLHPDHIKKNYEDHIFKFE